jgi:hypothetical protein
MVKLLNKKKDKKKKKKKQEIKKKKKKRGGGRKLIANQARSSACFLSDILILSGERLELVVQSSPCP